MGLTKKGLERLWMHITNKFDELVGKTPVSEQIEEAVGAIEIPQSDWNESNPAANDYIKNRTHYTTEHVIDCTVDLGVTGEWRKISNTAPLRSVTDTFLVNAPTVIANIDGVETEIEVEWYDRHLATTRAIAYRASYVSGKYNDEVHIRLVDEERAGLADDFEPGIYVLNNSPIKTVTWYEVVCLDEKYIPETIARLNDIPEIPETPQSDWNQYDSTEKDYIKNRTHYAASDNVDCTVNLGIDGTWRKVSDICPTNFYATFKIFQVADNGEVVVPVSWDFVNTRYATGMTGSYSIEYRYGAIDGVDSIYLLKVGSGGNYRLGSGVYVKDDSPITRFTWEYTKTLDEKYIPSTIARKADITALGLPKPTVEDAGKILRVNAEGKYELVAIANAEEATF